MRIVGPYALALMFNSPVRTERGWFLRREGAPAHTRLDDAGTKLTRRARRMTRGEPPLAHHTHTPSANPAMSKDHLSLTRAAPHTDSEGRRAESRSYSITRISDANSQPTGEKKLEAQDNICLALPFRGLRQERARPAQGTCGPLPALSKVARPPERTNDIPESVLPSTPSADAGTSSLTHCPAAGMSPMRTRSTQLTTSAPQ